MKNILFVIAAVVLLSSFHTPDEGIYPVSKINAIDLKKAGINLTADQIFNENGGALSDALVRLGGCTGSFISKEGLIITNHHCVFGSVSRLSTEKDNYLRDGFYSSTKNGELHTGLPAKITISTQDVSEGVLKDLGSLSGKERDLKFNTNIIGIVSAEKQKDSLYTYEVSEMFEGKQYFLFKYLTLLDVRLVYVPPRYIGEFGAETDNWEWPRHTGDFSVVRAYVGKDGKPAKYAADNIPFEPNRFLKINPKGTSENDAVFILGYPGKTYRHQPHAFLKYQYQEFMPEVVDWFSWRIKTMYEVSEGNETKYLSFAGNIKSLANTEKNFRGKIQGLTRTDVLKEKEQLDQSLINFAKTLDPSYANVVSDLNAIYAEKMKFFDRDFYLGRLLSDVPGMAAAMHAYLQNKTNKSHDFSRFASFYGLDDEALNIATMKYLVKKINEAWSKENGGAKPLPEYSADKFLKCYQKSIFTDYQNKLKPLLDKESSKIFKAKDPLFEYCEAIYIQLMDMQIREANFKAKNDLLMPKYTSLKEQYLKTDFIPDANGTLRFTYGRVKGFSPNDGEYNYAHTTLTGVLEKANSEEDYYMPQDAIDIYRRENVAKALVDSKSGKVVVGLLYNLDTTGGNSGSPILDANGNLVGVNFDRAYTATINDYAWNEQYSRSIGVDIRYVLYVMKYIGKADAILSELQINL